MTSSRVIEVRVLKFHPGRRQEFAASRISQLLPMLKRQGIEVIHHGPSLHDENTYFLIRLYRSVADRQAALDALYGSAEWLMNYEGPVLDMIDTIDTAVFAADESLIAVMKEAFGKVRPDSELAGKP